MSTKPRTTTKTSAKAGKAAAPKGRRTTGPTQAVRVDALTAQVADLQVTVDRLVALVNAAGPYPSAAKDELDALNAHTRR